ncbi:MAG: sulfotransferase domain-containing protein [Rhodocyclaceae bacterium]|nr:sulfotransferase domain-containing protein [Rhodocyclaceae bacterium]
MSVKQFDADPAYVATPGQPGYPRWTLDIASPELPCGVGWLAAAMMALGMPVFKPWGIFDSPHWIALGQQRFEYRCAGSGWSRLLPDLVDGRRFEFLSEPVPRFTHALPGAFPLTQRRVLFVRDPRDALASAAARARRIGQIPVTRSNVAFALSPRAAGHADRISYLADFLKRWLAALDADRDLVVRFEDAKHEPEQTLRRVLDWLAFPCSSAALTAACRAASHERVCARDRALVAAGAVPTPILGPGLAFAWQHDPDPELWAAMAGRFDRICRQLGYDAIARDR